MKQIIKLLKVTQSSSSLVTEFILSDRRNMSTPVQEKKPKVQKNILIGCTGSVATIKLPILVKKLVENEHFNIRVVVTEHAKHFFQKEDIPSDVDIISDSDEWSAWKDRGDPVVHIELGKWADIFVIAPLDANTLAKLAVVCILMTVQ